MNALGIFLLGGGSALLVFASGWAVCNDLKDRRAERAEAQVRKLRDELNTLLLSLK